MKITPVKRGHVSLTGNAQTVEVRCEFRVNRRPLGEWPSRRLGPRDSRSWREIPFALARAREVAFGGREAPAALLTGR